MITWSGAAAIGWQPAVPEVMPEHDALIGVGKTAFMAPN